jgi:hypothetical protein
MNDTDRLVAAIFSATMNAREPTAAGLIEQYEFFLQEIPARRQAEQQKRDATANAAWTNRTYP